MTGPIDPDATRPFNGGDATMPAGPRPGGSAPGDPVTVGPPPGGPPRGPVDEGDDDARRNWWWIAAAALALGIAVGVVVALLASGGDDKKNDATTTTSSSTTTSSTTSPPVTSPPTSPPTNPSPPGQVTDLTAEPGGGSGEVSLHWDAVSGAAQYRIYRSATQGITGSLVATVNTDSYVDVPGAHAYYQVSAVGSGGLEGERSVEVCGAVVGDSC